VSGSCPDGSSLPADNGARGSDVHPARRTIWDTSGHSRSGPDVDDPLYTEDLDLTAVTIAEQLTALLQTVHRRADKPSLRALRNSQGRSRPM
jgi:hypothetical protein